MEIDIIQTSALSTSFDAQQVWNMGVDEAMVLCKKFKALSDAFPDDWCSPDEDGDNNEEEEEEEDKVDEESCSEDMSDHIGGTQTSKNKEWEVEEIYNVRVCDEAVRKAKGAVKIQLQHPTLPESPLFDTMSLSESSKPYMLQHTLISWRLCCCQAEV